jgi:ribosome maturation factor RimP
LLSSLHHISPLSGNGRAAPISFREDRTAQSLHTTERTLYREVSRQVETGLPGVEVLALELVSPTRFCVYVDHPQGVDHALCERVTGVLRSYLDRYTVDVSSPGFERPLRKPAHFRNAIGRKVSIRTDADVGGRKNFKGQVLAVGEDSLSLGTDGSEAASIPYEAIVRANLIDEG